MSEMKTIGIIVCFVTIFGLFAYGSNQIFPDLTQINSTTTENYDTPIEGSGGWVGSLNPFTYINYFYDILTFEVFGLSEDLQMFLLKAVYIPLAGITIIIVLYFVRGN